MMSRVRMGFMLALTAGLLAATVQTVTMPKAYADIAPVQPTFSAGNANGPICACPVRVGNCVCQWNN